MVSEEIASVRRVTNCLFLALHRRKPSAISACYDSAGVFTTPILGDVPAKSLERLWTLFFSRTRHNALTYKIVDAGLVGARVEGHVSYVLLDSGRRVSCPFDSVLHVRDRLIRYHVDSFDTWGWAQMAYGTKGLMLGWSNSWHRRLSNDLRSSLSLRDASHCAAPPTSVRRGSSCR